VPLLDVNEDVYSPGMGKNTDKRLQPLESKAPAATLENGKPRLHIWLTGIAAVVAILAGLAAGIRYVVSSEMAKALQPIELRLEKVDARLDGQEKRQDRIDAKAIPDLLRTPLPADRKGATGAVQQRGDALKTATVRRIETDPALVAESGAEVLGFIKKNQNDAPAWNTFMEHVNYRSFLNAGLVPSISSQALEKTSTAFFRQPETAGGRLPVAKAAWGTDDPERAAIFEAIGGKLNSGKNLLPTVFILENGSVVLDGNHARHVRFENCRIIYRGGPVEMEDVVFLNCTFEMTFTVEGRELGTKLLASTEVTFKSPAVRAATTDDLLTPLPLPA
jgi:hypothetical protein